MRRLQTNLDRRTLLRLAGLGGMGWLTPVAHVLSEEAEAKHDREPAQSIIMLWMGGGPSQLDTLDPQPKAPLENRGETKAIATALKGVQLAEGLEHLAEEMGSVCLVRNMVSKEGDHERGAYMLKTGYRPDPTVVHPSIGAIVCHQLPIGGTQIPRHVSILPNQWYGRGGLLGNQYDAFKTYDPIQRVPDVSPGVPDKRIEQRIRDLAVVEDAFASGRRKQAEGTLHRANLDHARRMMTSEQLKAFEVIEEPAEVRARYGDTPFGRGCLAARRLISVGVRCVEVTLDGWDTHAKNYEGQRTQVQKLDPALSALLSDLRQSGLLDKTLVVCGGEFGRTPKINGLGGRDHWPHGFSMLLAGGALRRGFVLGETDPQGSRIKLEEGTSIPDLHATLLAALSIDPHHAETSPAGRPIKFSEGTPLKTLLTADAMDV